MTPPGSENKDVSDPSYRAADFKAQVLGGGLRWFATVMALLSLALLGYLLSEGDRASLDVPIHLEGNAALALVGAFAVVWVVLATINWIAWRKRKKNFPT